MKCPMLKWLLLMVAINVSMANGVAAAANGPNINVCIVNSNNGK